MKTTKSLVIASITGVVLAGAIAAPALAWHPKGVIKKYVQDVTTNSAMVDANDAASAITVHPGDTLKYTIEVSNQGAAASNGNNDMYYTTLTDTLPAGVSLTDGSGKTSITEDLGVVKPGDKVTKTYTVKVTSTKDGDLLKNTASFKGDSKVKDNPQSGCDVADVKVNVPAPTPTPTPTPTPAPTTPAPTKPQLPAELPKTGAGNVVVPAGIVAAFGYAGYLLHLKRKAATQEN